MNRHAALSALLFFLAALNVTAQQPAPSPAAEAARVATREKLRKVLDTTGPKINVAFRQTEKQPFNFVGVMKEGLKNSESLEIVVGVSTNDTITFRVYPHFRGDYINIEKVKDGVSLMHKFLSLTDRNFLYWGVDNSNDAFSGYTFTLESGFPEAALDVVLRSLRNIDNSVGELRPYIDGSSPSS
ncbi:MAG: hypothetical protein H0T45_14345 [Pyrinomonadaceae bacterium]|nr:hypothetical protein [Pyrinomonadaceae bacterium]